MRLLVQRAGREALLMAARGRYAKPSKTGLQKRTAAASARASSARAAVSKAQRAALRSEIKSVVQGAKESKDEELGWTTVNASTSGGFTGELYKMPQGSGVWHRIGDTVTPTKILMRYHFAMQAGSDTVNVVRLMIVQCKVPADEADVADFPPIYREPSDAWRRKYRLLHDEHCTLNAKYDGSGGGGGKVPWYTGLKTLELYGKRLRQMRWTDTGSAIEPNVHGAIKIYVVSDSTLIPHPHFSYYVKMYAKDDN